MGPAELFRFWFETVWNESRSDLIPEYFAADGIAHSVDEHGKKVVGPAAFRPFYDRIKEAFPDIRFTVEHVIEEGDHAAGRWSAEATHKGPVLGVPPTNQKVRLTGMAFARIKDGKILEAWDEWDRFGLAIKIGAVTPVSGPG